VQNKAVTIITLWIYQYTDADVPPYVRCFVRLKWRGSMALCLRLTRCSIQARMALRYQCSSFTRR